MVIKRYPVKDPLLKSLVKYFWIVKEDSHDLHHKYLPVGNIDLVLNLGRRTKYITPGNEEIITSRLYFNGITERYKLNIQNGTLNMLGISFFPTGLFPFLKTPLADFKNQTIDFNLVSEKMGREIIETIGHLDNIEYTLHILEIILLKYVDTRVILDNKALRLCNTFNNSIQDMTIETFCSEYGVNKRTLERFFNKYIGTSPKTYAKIKRFQKILRQLENKDYHSLTELTYEHNYYDQMHFIKDFKSFTGSTPTDYIMQKSSLRDIITLL